MPRHNTVMLKILQARPTVSANKLLLLVAAFLVIAANSRFWGIVISATADNGGRGLVVAAMVALALLSLTLLMLLPLSLRWLLKPGLTVVLLLAAGAAYFISGYGAVIDRHALASVYQTDAREAGEWLSWRMLLAIGLLGGLPAAAVWWARVEWQKPLRETLSRLKLFALACALLGVAAFVGGKDIASLLRNHMELRHIANPFALLAAQLSYLDHARNDNRPLQRIALDARRGNTLTAGKRPVVLVLAIGESARAASLDLNGYARDTDTDLHPVPLVNFPRVSSCGTNTATSLPCMFSGVGRSKYEDGMAKYRENLLDVLMRGGYDVLWLDNNTGSKGLAKRATERNAGKTAAAGQCNDEGCYDDVLVSELRRVLPTIKRDTVIVTHLLGSHGPAYYARYPSAFAAFVPECRTNELQRCSDEQIRNSYDNSMLYTSHVLAEIVELLGERRALRNRVPLEDIKCLAALGHVKAAQPGACGGADAAALAAATTAASAALPDYDAAMLFVSDHGESLGENGLYLHGAPYTIAPDEQTHVPMLLWASDAFTARRGLDLGCVRGRAEQTLSHDHFFHAVLGLGDVATGDYRASMDPFSTCVPRVGQAMAAH